MYIRDVTRSIAKNAFLSVEGADNSLFIREVTRSIAKNTFCPRRDAENAFFGPAGISGQSQEQCIGESWCIQFAACTKTG